MKREKLSKNFYRDEFACKCGCGFDTVDWQLVEGLQVLRDMVGVPITVNSGCRCKAHNRAVGGKPESQHLLGKAADIVIKGYPPHVVQGMAEQIEMFRDGGLHAYNTFTHCDCRNGRARW